MNRALTDNLFSKYSKLVYEKSGINLTEGKKALLQARLNKRLRQTGFRSYEEYFDYVTAPENGNELVHFLDAISTNLTYFFRETQHFDFINEVFLPEVIERKNKAGKSRLRLWSAACSTGEEPYSLAMCLLARLDDGRGWDLKLLATDISTRVLQICAQGVYDQDKLKKVPVEFRKRYFRKLPDGSGRYEVVPLLKRIVVVRYLNLLKPFPFTGRFDAIFCRNVMIYFDKKTQEQIITQMTRFLEPGGYLFIGHSESLTGLNHSLTYVRPATYRK